MRKTFVSAIIDYLDSEPKKKLITKVYKCDPNKNTSCHKRNCQTKCFYTKHKAYSADGKIYFIKGREEKVKRVQDDGGKCAK